jgi:hypothetical protein
LDQCAAFLLNVFDFYAVEFVIERVSYEFLNVLVVFLRNSVLGMIGNVSKVVGYLAELSCEIRDFILSIFPFAEMLGCVRGEKGEEGRNSAFLGIVCRCCVFALPEEAAGTVAELLIGLLPILLGEGPLALIVHSLYLLSSNPAVLSQLWSTAAFGIMSKLLSSEKGVNTKLAEQILVLARVAFSQWRALPIPYDCVSALVSSISPQASLRAVELASVAVLDNPDVHVRPFLDASIVSNLCANLASQSAAMKKRSADFLFLLSHWMQPMELDLLLQAGTLQTLLDLFEFDDTSLTIKLLQFIRSSTAAPRPITTRLFDEHDLFLRLEELADGSNPDVAAYASAFLLELSNDEEEELNSSLTSIPPPLFTTV